ncbi:MAG: hypothetical protein COU06_02175, partial [Candidatus Harrisonbacteria bacterium CG10_big_fil_rev_8_21_14_0_10_38_8]
MNKEILKKILSVFLICQLTFTGLILQPQVAKAVSGVPQIIAYQGRLTDSAGELLGGDDGTAYYFKFSIYDNATAGSGTKLWPTTAPSSTSATVTNGVFTVNIGDTDAGYPDALDYDFQTNRDVYLQVEVSSDNVTFEALDPRQRITSAGFAVNAGTLGGFTASQSPTGNQIPVLNSGNLIIAGSLTTGATTTFNTVVYTWPGSDGSNGQFLSTDGNGALSWSTVTIPDHWSANGSYIYSSSTASGVGIGTDTPSTTLHVVGTFRASATTTLDTGSLVSNVADGSSAVAYNFNTANALSTTGAKIASFKNNGTEKAYVDKDGVYTANLVQVGAQSAAPVSGVSLFYEAPGSSKTAGLYFEQGGVTGRGGLMRWYKYNNSSDKIGFYLNAGGKTTDTPIIYAEQGNSQANQATYFGLPTGVLSGVKLGLDAEISGTTYDGSNRGTPADTYFTKSAASGGNFSTFYDGTEVQRFSSSTNFAIVPNTVIGGAITDTASTTLHVVGTLRTSATSTFDTGVLVSGVADGATAKAFTLNSVALSTSGAKLLSLQNNGTEKASVDKDGNLYLGGLTTAYLTTANQGGVEHIKVEGKLGFGSTGHVVYLESTGSQGVNVKGISGATLMQWDKESQTTINAYGLALSANLPLVFDNRGGDTKITKTSASGGNWNFAYDSDVAARFDTDGFSVASSTLIGVLGQASTTLHVVGDFKVTATSTFEGPAIFADADLGAIRFETDAGQVSWVDLPVSSSADSGSVQSYTAQLDGNPMISVYAEADGSGGTTNRRVGIGTFVPSSTLHVVGTL